jgi:hypothetical protein
MTSTPSAQDAVGVAAVVGGTPLARRGAPVRGGASTVPVSGGNFSPCGGEVGRADAEWHTGHALLADAPSQGLPHELQIRLMLSTIRLPAAALQH